MTAWQWSGATFERCDTLPISDRAFRYGMSVFESIRISNSKPQHCAAHLERLREACASVGFRSDPTVLSAAARLLESGGQDGFARIYVTAGDGSPTGAASDPRIIVFIEPREPSLPPAYRLQTAQAAAQPMFGGLKTGNYWSNLYVLQQARAAGFDEALLFTAEGELVSACCANVFIVLNGELRTPAPSCGARRGVIRELVLHARPVSECLISQSDLFDAEEVFLTNSWFGLMPVGTIDGRSLPSRNIAASLATLSPPHVSSA